MKLIDTAADDNFKWNPDDLDLRTCSTTLPQNLRLPVFSAKLSNVKLRKASIINNDEQAAKCSLSFARLPVMESDLLPCRMADIFQINEFRNKDDGKEEKQDENRLPIMQIELSFDDRQRPFNLQAGDSIGLITPNPIEEALACLQRQPLPNEGEEKECHGPFKSTDLCWLENAANLLPHLPNSVQLSRSALDLLRYHCDLRSLPKKAFIRALADSCLDACERQRLLQLSSREGAEEYDRLVLRPHLTLLDLLQCFPSCRPSLTTLLVHLPALRPRYYSMVTSRQDPAKPGHTVCSVAFSLLQHPKVHRRNGSQLFGLFTGESYRTFKDKKSREERKTTQDADDNLLHKLQQLALNSDERSLFVFKRKNPNFRLPEMLKQGQPIVMVSCGTGLAPYISFLDELQSRRQNQPDTESPKIVLVHGCRDPFNFIYRSRIEKFQKTGLLHRTLICYSRFGHEPKDGGGDGVRHVQHLIGRERDLFKPLLQRADCLVYVCGELKAMQTAVLLAMADCVGGMEQVKQMQTEKRFLVDSWA